MTVYVLTVVSRYDDYLAGVFSTEEKALEYFRAYFKACPDGVAIAENTWHPYINTYELDNPK